MAKKNNKGGGCILIVIGPALVFFSIAALWKNETRYDFHKAAKRTTPVVNINTADNDMLLSLTGPMDQDLTMEGKYVEEFRGYLTVQRNAEIYAWDRDEDDGEVKWSRRWMSNVESNSRNNGIRQELNSGDFNPPNYDVGDLEVVSHQIEFVDSFTNIEPNSLQLSQKGQDLRLQPEKKFLYLYKGRGDSIGDERLSFRGLAVPATATYFGKYSGGQGVAHDAEKRDGMINQIIQDTGILHHIVAGDRDTALGTMKAYISRLKWIVRGIGTVCIIVGCFMAFASVFQFLFRIPFIGPVAEYGTWLLAVIIGLPIAIITIALAYTFSHPLLVFGTIAAIFGFIYWLGLRKRKAQQAIKRSLDEEYGHQLDFTELKELEFMELASLASAGSNFGKEEKDFLFEWGRKHGWDDSMCEQLLQKAKMQKEDGAKVIPTDDHLHNLIKIALADGSLSSYEIKTIRKAAENVGYDRKTVDELMDTIERTALMSAA